MKMTITEQAVKMLIDLLVKDYEWPEAVFTVTQVFGVKAGTLEEAYDQYILEAGSHNY